MVKFLRAIVFLPVREAEERESMVLEVDKTTSDARRDSRILLDRIERSSENLRRTYDQLLERT
jgi:hypothetical protein